MIGLLLSLTLFVCFISMVIVSFIESKTEIEVLFQKGDVELAKHKKEQGFLTILARWLFPF